MIHIKKIGICLTTTTLLVHGVTLLCSVLCCVLLAHIMIYFIYSLNLSDGVKTMLTGHCGSCLSRFLYEEIACFMTFENRLRK